MNRKLLIAALLLGGCATPPKPAETAGSRENLQGLQMAGIKTEQAKISSLRPAIQLSGQVTPTERGQATITAPLNGVLIEPLITAGQRIAKGDPVAVVNSVYGQTGLQLAQKLEQDETTLVNARTALASARSNLATAQTALAQARGTESGAADNLTQAQAENVNAKKDLERKIKLEKGGVFSTSDVDDARERNLKALSSQKNMIYAKTIAKQGVNLANSNVQMLSENIPLAQQNVDLAQANLDRDRSVFSGGLSGATLPQNLTPVGLEGKGRYAGAAADSTSFYIRSPISGIVTSVNMTAGLSVAPGATLATVVDTRTVYVDANAFESDVQMIHPGDKLEVTTSASSETFTGRVTYIGKQVDPTARTIPVRSLIQNGQGILRPAMFVTVKLLSAPRRAVVTIPEDAVLIHGGERFVYVESSEGKFAKRSVRLGTVTGGRAEIVSGVKAGEKVVTDGNLILEGG